MAAATNTYFVIALLLSMRTDQTPPGNRERDYNQRGGGPRVREVRVQNGTYPKYEDGTAARPRYLSSQTMCGDTGSEAVRCAAKQMLQLFAGVLACACAGDAEAAEIPSTPNNARTSARMRIARDITRVKDSTLSETGVALPVPHQSIPISTVYARGLTKWVPLNVERKM
jgi:hypothetical protein